MLTEKFITLLNALRQATVDGRLKWAEDVGGRSYHVRFSGATFEIDWENEDDLDPDFSVTIKNKEGKTLEVEFFDRSRNNPEYYDLVRSIYEHAHLGGSEIENALDSMIRDLSGA